MRKAYLFDNDLRSEVFKYVAAICIQDAQCLCKVMSLKKSSSFVIEVNKI